MQAAVLPSFAPHLLALLLLRITLYPLRVRRLLHFGLDADDCLGAIGKTEPRAAVGRGEKVGFCHQRAKLCGEAGVETDGWLAGERGVEIGKFRGGEEGGGGLLWGHLGGSDGPGRDFSWGSHNCGLGFSTLN